MITLAVSILLGELYLRRCSTHIEVGLASSKGHETFDDLDIFGTGSAGVSNGNQNFGFEGNSNFPAPTPPKANGTRAPPNKVCLSPARMPPPI